MVKDRDQQTDKLRQELKRRILVLDGAMGTRIQGLNPTEDDFGGASFEGCNEYLNLKQPRWIREIYRSYLEAGADIIETNTFGGTPLVLNEFGLGEQAHEINKAAAQMAKEVATEFSTPDHPRFVAGSMGPTTKAISVTGGVSFDELIENYLVQAKALYEGGADYLIIETVQDTRNAKAGLVAIQKLMDETGTTIPIAISGTIEAMGTMLAGQSVDALVASLAHLDLLYLGLNCATGPEFMTDHIRTMASLAPFPVACMPNAGLPDEEGNYLETPRMISKVLEHFVEEGWINLVGGCCGTTAQHIAELSRMVRGKKPREFQPVSQSFLSGIEYLEITDEVRPVIVGERCNVIGSKKFRELICDGKFDEATEIGRTQVKNGAHVLDVCLANPDRNEKEDVDQFLEALIKKIKLPLMIDSTDEEVVELALTYSQGKAIINSINLEDGEERFQKIIPLAKKYGAALIVGTIDDDPDQGMGVTRERKREIADRSYQLLTEKYGVAPQDIYWDPLVFPCGTGDEKYVGSAVETIEGVRLLKERYPNTKTVLGISNVSFGLPLAGRKVLNSVFLYHCVQAGLDLAIVNAKQLNRYASIPEEERKLSEDLLFAKGEDFVGKFANHFRDKKAKVEISTENLSLDERLSKRVIEGSKDGLIEDIDLKLKEASPMEIINGPLMAGMDEVGIQFNANKLIVAEVLQSAEVMKAAVGYLEPKMDQREESMRGKVVLATVKGDVHDIGKNLVDIILSNNGFRVIDLGIKVAPDKLIQAVEENKPDIVGLSGLLVKSAQQMVATASDFSKAGIETPILVGGAALSSKFVDKKIATAYSQGTVAYARDAMQGLDLAKTIVDPEKFDKLKQEISDRRKQLEVKEENLKAEQPPKPILTRSPEIDVITDIPQPEDYERHVLIKKTSIDQIWNFLNPMMLYGRHLGLRGTSIRHLQDMARDPKLKKEMQIKNPKAYATWELVEAVKNEYRDTDCMRPVAIYQFFRVRSEGNEIHLYLPHQDKPVETFAFHRMDRTPYCCLSDYVHSDLSKNDNMAFFSVSVGKGLRAVAESLKKEGDYLTSHILQALALESAEGYAEYIHSHIRRIWGFPDPPSMTMLDRFKTKYRGKRYSFGYPACPQLSDQRILFRLLKPEEIGVQLTETEMMDPEASISAIVFHHPQATYFSVGSSAVEGKNE